MTKPSQSPDEQKRILVVEDDPALSLQVRNFLDSSGFHVTAADTRRKATSLLEQNQYDLLLLDWKLPDGEGVDICHQLRLQGRIVPVLMLTAEDGLDNKLHGFASGADDYLTKPFSPRELLARVKALLKRPPASPSNDFKLGALDVHLGSGDVFLNNEKLALLPKEFALLEFFVRHPDRYFSAENLLSNVWTADAEVGLATVRVQINNLRKKLGSESRLIQNSPGLGYRLATPKFDCAESDGS